MHASHIGCLIMTGKSVRNHRPHESRGTSRSIERQMVHVCVPLSQKNRGYVEEKRSPPATSDGIDGRDKHMCCGCGLVSDIDSICA